MRLVTRISMMLIAVLFLMLPGLTSFRAAPLTSPTLTPTPKAESLSEVCTRAVTGINDLRRNLGLPYDYHADNPARVAGDFDVNTYFKVLERLQVEPGLALDYVWLPGGIGGEPILYTHPMNTPSYKTYEGYREARHLKYAFQEDELYLDNIVVEDSAAGYLQFVILRIMGDQFYLYWHALYDDWEIICDAAAMERAISGYAKWQDFQPMPDEVKAQARLLNTAPIVALTEKQVVVSVLTFTKWGGFIRTEYTFERSVPHRLINRRGKGLVRFDCGVSF